MPAAKERRMSNETSEREIRELHAHWFEVAAAKDLDGAMSHIAEDVLSYEHGVPLQYQGIAAVRSVCRAGFELAAGEFEWTVPDLKVFVRDDLAVAFGLNRMETRPPGKPAHVSFSRGTRVFQKIEGEWKLIHQHVSFPFDPTTGRARVDLTPE
jgi:ketosteroid isomerase-like protein